MTAETDLLPCPFCGSAEPIVAEPPEILPLSFQIICSGSGCNAVVESRTLARAKLMWNRRANVAHATAAKDAEIEALRAEVRDAYAAADSKAGWEWKKRAEAAESRAERLAEALRWLVAYVRETAHHNAPAAAAARAALRDHDQEVGNG